MKVYLVEKDNCEAYEDNHHWIDSVHKTFRSASQSLIDNGFDPYFYKSYDNTDVHFYWEESDGYMADSRGARIIEMELED